MDGISQFIWKYGGRFDYWIQKIDRVGRYIERFGLKPVGREHLPMVTADEGDTAALRVIGPSFPGGIRTAHFHYGGNIYMLNAEQWQEFSKDVILDMRKKLDRAGEVIERGGSVGFSQLLDLSGSVEGLM